VDAETRPRSQIRQTRNADPTFRADEGCYDPVDQITLLPRRGSANPYMTFIDATTQAIIAHVIMDQPAGTPSAGLEACVFDAKTGVAGAGVFYVNNDGSNNLAETRTEKWTESPVRHHCAQRGRTRRTGFNSSTSAPGEPMERPRRPSGVS